MEFGIYYDDGMRMRWSWHMYDIPLEGGGQGQLTRKSHSLKVTPETTPKGISVRVIKAKGMKQGT